MEEQKLLDAEKQLWDYFNDRSGLFMHNLITAFLHADAENLRKLSLGYPELGEVIYKYHHQEGYWNGLERKFN